MKKNILSLCCLVLLTVAALLFSGFRKNQNKLFYYAFNEKIYLEMLPGKFALRFSDSSAAKQNLPLLEKKVMMRTGEWKDNRTILFILLKEDDNAIKDIIEQAGVATVQPVYKAVQEQKEMVVTDEILVRFKPSTAKKDIDLSVKLLGLVQVEKGELFYTFRVPKSASTLSVANAVMESGLAEFAHPNFYIDIEFHGIPNDAYFNYQWNLHNTGQVINDGHTGTPDADIDAPEAWDITLGSSAIKIAVLDEGVTSNHPDLPNTRQIRLNGSNFSTTVPGNDPSPITNGNHGNACAGIIAASRNNTEGVAGIAPNCKIMPVKILNPGASSSNIANAFTFAKNNGADIISNSWGYSGVTNPNYVPAIVTAIQDAVTTGRGGKGCIVVFSASNSADHVDGINGIVAFPSNVNITGVLTIGASDRYDAQANYSPSSNTASTQNQIVDMVAPSHRAYPSQIAGEDFEIWSMDMPGTAGYNPQSSGIYLPASGTNYQSYTGRMGGTSSSCPEVAGAAALLLSLNANLTYLQVFDILTSTADKVGGYTYTSGKSNEMGYGRLNLFKAVTLASADLYMKDQSSDAGVEPNPSSAAYYQTPDIWVRNANDGGTVHENPEYGQTNYVYVKVRNRGYLSSAATGNNLKVYWAKASTGLSWTYPWTGASYNCSGTPLSIGGQIGTQVIGSISSGGSTTLIFAWQPPKPDDFIPCFGSDASHFCLLARIETSSTSPYGMTFPETTNLGNNVKNNNNIVWKNISIVNVLPDALMVRTSVLITGAKLLARKFTVTDITFKATVARDGGNIFDAANVEIDLGNFTKAWLEKSGKVEGGEITRDEKGNTVIKLTSTSARIYGVPIGSTEVGSITAVIRQTKFMAGKSYLFDLQQYDGKLMLGGEQFDVRFVEKKGLANSTPENINKPVEKANASILKAFQQGKQLMLSVNDDKTYMATIANYGGQVFYAKNITRNATVNVSTFKEGIYFIKLVSTKDRSVLSTQVMIQ